MALLSGTCWHVLFTHTKMIDAPNPKMHCFFYAFIVKMVGSNILKLVCFPESLVVCKWFHFEHLCQLFTKVDLIYSLLWYVLINRVCFYVQQKIAICSFNMWYTKIRFGSMWHIFFISILVVFMCSFLYVNGTFICSLVHSEPNCVFGCHWSRATETES